MTNRRAKHPTLYTAPAGPDAEPVLLGRRCACGYTFFPPQDYGCEKCGAGPEDLSAVELPGQGKLLSFTTVRHHWGNDPELPFSAGSILLDDGPVILGLLTSKEGADLAIGQRVHATLIETAKDKADNVTVECRFASGDAREGDE